MSPLWATAIMLPPLGKLDGVGEAHDAAETDVEATGENGGAVDENRGLVLGAGEDDDGLAGRG